MSGASKRFDRQVELARRRCGYLDELTWRNPQKSDRHLSFSVNPSQMCWFRRVPQAASNRFMRRFDGSEGCFQLCVRAPTPGLDDPAPTFLGDREHPGAAR
jgi:hypothetical protein